MRIRVSWVPITVRLWMFGAALALGRASGARAEGDQESPSGMDPVVVKLLANVKPSVVQIQVRGLVHDDGDWWLGSGVVVDAEKGLIATNYHVIAQCRREQGVRGLPRRRGNDGFSDGRLRGNPAGQGPGPDPL